MTYKLDANETVFFTRELESLDNRLFEAKQRELKYREVFPVSTNDDPGADNITYYMYDQTGLAKIISDYGDDLPSSDVFAQEFTAKVKSIGTSFHYTTQEIRAARMANKPLEAMKADAARRAIRERENRLVWLGDTHHGIQGIVSHPNVSTQAAPNGTAASTLWVNKTGQEIIDDIALGIRVMRANSNGVWSPDSMVVGNDEYTVLATRMVDAANGSNVTCLKWLMENQEGFGIKNVWAVEDIEDAFDTENAAILFVRDPEVIEVKIPMEMMMHAPQQRGLRYYIPVESRFAGVVLRHPLAFLFLTGI